ncbi:Uncharacterised protein [uncultured archaeon]|nr:Uncharacterised protein [uncultured archaeon]
MSEKLDIYKSAIRVELAKKRLADSPLSEFNKSKILEYIKICYARGLSAHRINKYFDTLRTIISWLNKDVSNITSEDILNLLVRINQSDLSEWTKRDYKTFSRAFLEWAGYEKELELIKPGRSP